MLYIITPGFPINEEDSTCLPAIQNMVLAMAQHYGASKICVVSLHYPFAPLNYSWNGVSVTSIAGKNKKGLSKLFVWYRAIRTLKTLHKKKAATQVLAFWLTDAALVATYFAKQHKLPYLLWQQGQDVKANNRYLKLFPPKQDHILCISEFSQHQLRINHQLNSPHVVRNGILKSQNLPFNFGERTIAVMGAGSLVPVKNYALFIEVLSELNSLVPGLRFIQVGEGVLAQDLKKQAAQLGLEHALSFLGNTPHQEVLEHMSKAKVFLHTSNFEGSSTVLAEALYMGCKVVSTCGLSSNDPPQLRVATTKTDLLKAVLTALSDKEAPKRILAHALEDSVVQIDTVFKHLQ